MLLSYKLEGVGYTGESGLLGVAYAGKSEPAGVNYIGKPGLPGVACTDESRSVEWPTRGSPQKCCSHKNSPV